MLSSRPVTAILNLFGDLGALNQADKHWGSVCIYKAMFKTLALRLALCCVAAAWHEPLLSGAKVPPRVDGRLLWRTRTPVEVSAADLYTAGNIAADVAQKACGASGLIQPSSCNTHQ